ncbi:hypothetical protein [Haloquadratum walsbyi]|jgi:hypothetical protein|uniref:Uncharacterized protein n=1 Tax=Haloquadratum walsbyi J07HQW2 TaxID=1238425 RepID=U1PPL8_9EURY|nr:hypothetical protein [Haloquadratum walsbyi]ERG94256.1 MAG: hypothetical protein J07HQW2_00690 [Haloquadratum walsbyi J07HQW2]
MVDEYPIYYASLVVCGGGLILTGLTEMSVISVFLITGGLLIIIGTGIMFFSTE